METFSRISQFLYLAKAKKKKKNKKKNTKKKKTKKKRKSGIGKTYGRVFVYIKLGYWFIQNHCTTMQDLLHFGETRAFCMLLV